MCNETEDEVGRGKEKGGASRCSYGCGRLMFHEGVVLRLKDASSAYLRGGFKSGGY